MSNITLKFGKRGKPIHLDHIEGIEFYINALRGVHGEPVVVREGNRTTYTFYPKNDKQITIETESTN